ncbi:uncharacterized protein LOC110704329 [Chenopodium quinoa]|uniref:uncharacterized protein LOC110704329 n=1 Tax=Chenopodium quinoa TaxID=63459 RepID=UPI000B79027F|nr:uncharacterized protein LOC110704329 [Chenopodium quinoa]
MNLLRRIIQKANPKAVAAEHNKSFSIWFKNKVMRELQVSSSLISDRLKSLAYGPDFQATFYSGYIINCWNFFTKDQDYKSTMKISGVSLEAEAMHFSSAKDNRPVLCKMQYYGVIKEICELHYSDFSVPVFCCKWADNNNNVVHDDMGHTSMNLHKIGHKEDPYILACQAKQVFYMTDPPYKRRSIVIAPRPRYAIDEHDDNVDFEERLGLNDDVVNDDVDADDSLTYVCNDHEEGIWANNKDGNTKGPQKRRR